MKLKRAELIAALIRDFDTDCKYTDYMVGVELRPYYESDYSVKLYYKTDAGSQLVILTLFARALELLGTQVHLSFYGSYIELY